MKFLAVSAMLSFAFASFNAQAHDKVFGPVAVPSSLNYGASFTSLESQTTFLQSTVQMLTH